MALRAGYYGLKRFARNKLSILAASMPADIGPDNPIAGKNDVLTGIDLLNDTVGWTGKNELPNNLVNGSANHVNYSVKDNKSVEIYTDAGGSTAQTTMILVSNADNYKPKAGQKILSVSEVATPIQIVVAGYNGTTWVKNLANTATHTPFTIDYDGYDRVGVYLLVNANNEIDHKIAYPMITTPEKYTLSPTYAPYHESVEEMFEVKTGSIVDGPGVTQYASWCFTNRIGNLVYFQYRFTVGSESISVAETVIGDLGIKPIQGNIVYQFVDRFGETTPVLLAVSDQGKVVLVGGFTLLTGKTYVGSGVFMISPTASANREISADPEVKEPTKKATKKKVIKEEEE